MSHPVFSQRLAAFALAWLAFGAFALLLTPLPAHNAQFGWSPLFWLVLAPVCVLGGLRLRRQAWSRWHG